MPIFDMYGGRPNIYTENETDRINNPEKYNYDQAQYDAFIASLDAKVASRQAVDQRGREVVPTSYANFGTGGTNPGFSLAGRAGHTSGGLAGNAGTAQYADGGIVQHMQLGGMASPYADPMPKMSNHMAIMPPNYQGQETGSMGPPQQSQGPGSMGGVGGLFQNMMGMQQAQMGGAPLEVYGNYLNNVYTAPQAESSQEQVSEFIDMVDQAERAHFGAEESFGYGGGSYQKGLMSQYQQNIPPPMTGGGGPSGKEQSGGMSLTQQLPNGLTVY
tara:strand:+ start:236 stop:1054 length:819 start_codon:yes stop_codon:yes gene_type:complete